MIFFNLCTLILNNSNFEVKEYIIKTLKTKCNIFHTLLFAKCLLQVVKMSFSPKELIKNKYKIY